MEGTVRVFVYGTLKKGFANHYLMQDGLHGVVRFLTKGQTKEAYPLVVGTDAGKFHFCYLWKAKERYHYKN